MAIIDLKSTLEDLIKISPNYLSSDIDKNLLSTNGLFLQGQSKSINDTMTINRNRAKNSIIELSDDEHLMRTVAKIRNIPMNQTNPATAAFAIMLKVSDILERGKIVNVNEKQIIIDRRSTIICNGISFSLINDIAVRSTRRGDKHVISANYMNAESVNEFIHTYYTHTDDGEEAFGLLIDGEQYNYNTAEKTVTDRLQFTYDGIPFYYENKLAGMEVEYRRSSTETYKKLDLVYYQHTTTSASAIFYNDDRDGVVYIMNNPLTGIDENSEIRLTIKESIGEDGNFFIGTSETFFNMYRDDSYDYSGITVDAVIISDSYGGLNADNIEDLRSKLIDNKYGKATITDRDIMRYIGQYSADTIHRKKRNDLVNRLWNFYTMMRDNENVPMPTTTLRLRLKDSDFDVVHPVTQRKVLKANNQFSLLPGEEFIAGKVSVDDSLISQTESDLSRLLLNVPFTTMLNTDNTLTYFYSNIDENILLKYKYVNEFPYQFLTKYLHITRDSINKVDDNKYTVTIEALLNTPDDIGILNEDMTILDPTMVKCLMMAYDETGKEVAYLPVELTRYDITSNKYIFTGSFITNDYITSDRKLEITGGFKKVVDGTEYLDVLPFNDFKFDVAFLHKTAPVTQNHTIYTSVPGLAAYSICSIYQSSSTCNLTIELNRFMRSAVTLIHIDTETFYEISEVPMLKYSYSLANQDLVYSKFIAIKNTYLNIVKDLADFEINLKFIRTYGKSHHIKISGEWLNNLNPIPKFRIHGKDVDIIAIKAFIKKYFNSFAADNPKIYISNINTQIEKSFNVRSSEYLGIDGFNSAFQILEYIPADLTDKEALLAYVDEYMVVHDVQVSVVDTY